MYKLLILIILLSFTLVGCNQVELHDNIPEEYVAFSEETASGIEDNEFNFVTNQTEFDIFWGEENDALSMQIHSGVSYNRERSDNYIRKNVYEDIIDDILPLLKEKLETTDNITPDRIYLRVDYQTHVMETVDGAREEVDHWEHVAHRAFDVDKLLEGEGIIFEFLDL